MTASTASGPSDRFAAPDPTAAARPAARARRLASSAPASALWALPQGSPWPLVASCQTRSGEGGDYCQDRHIQKDATRRTSGHRRITPAARDLSRGALQV
eukprot:6175245-Pyramimonas_sp.AAC.1